MADKAESIVQSLDAAPEEELQMQQQQVQEVQQTMQQM